MNPGHLMRALLIMTAIVGVIVGHGAILYFFSTHRTASITVLASAAVILIFKHVGLIGTFYARLRRKSPRA